METGRLGDGGLVGLGDRETVRLGDNVTLRFIYHSGNVDGLGDLVTGNFGTLRQGANGVKSTQ